MLNYTLPYIQLIVFVTFLYSFSIPYFHNAFQNYYFSPYQFLHFYLQGFDLNEEKEMGM